MKKELLEPQFITLSDAAQVATSGGGDAGDFLRPLLFPVGAALFYIGQAGILINNAREGMTIGYASGYGFF